VWISMRLTASPWTSSTHYRRAAGEEGTTGDEMRRNIESAVRKK
jgi:hypothetical protein